MDPELDTGVCWTDIARTLYDCQAAVSGYGYMRYILI